MCGISGFIDFNNTSSIEVLKKMTDSLLHRGPDGFGYEFLAKDNFAVGLGHRRLSIIDLSEAGKQPMQHNNLWITFNGEIYNYEELKVELTKLNHTFISHSDTEVILHAFQEWGVSCISKFIGMFSFVIYDSIKNEIYCIRDRAGVKPLFYYFHEGLFLFGSELKSFHQHPKFLKEIDTSSVATFMQFGNIPAPHCIFKNCLKVRPGHYVKIQWQDNTRNKTEINIESIKYWDVYDSYNKPKLDISFEEAKIKTENILTSAFNYRMVSDVPVGVFLSGGYDSSCVTALLQRDRQSKLKTFTIAVPDIGLNEAPYAKDIAKHLGTDHTEYVCSESEALTLINDLPYFYDEPFADSSAIPTTLVCKIAKKDVTVALSADGGDEVFAGYNRYDYMMKHGRSLQMMPAIIRSTIHKTMDLLDADKIHFLKNKYNFSNRYEKLKRLLLDPSSKNIMMNLSTQFTAAQLEELLISKYTSQDTLYFSEQLKAEFYSPLSFMLAIDYQTYLADDILQKVDRASMTSSLEGREPFLDHRIIEWAAQLPDKYKYHRGEKKYILKEIVHQYIPKSLLDRPKMGFAIPIEKWLSNELKNLVMFYLDETLIRKQGIFNFDEVNKLKKMFYEGKKELAVKIWHILTFQMWFEKWMGK